jgi:hypothetical protein
MQNSAEIRWFWPSPLLEGVESWFRSAPFAPGGGKPRLDVYLVDPAQLELGIKKRGDKGGIEVKGLVGRFSSAFRIGTLVARGDLWTKWNSPALKLDGLMTQNANKIRWLRKFVVTDASVREIQLREDETPLNREERLPEQGCNLELTKVSLIKGGPEWSTIGFESFGDYISVEAVLRRTLEHLAKAALPTFSAGEELSYPAWLASRSSSPSHTAVST